MSEHDYLTADELLEQLALEGGAIVSSAECSEMEIADARMHNRMYVNERHLGFVRRPAKWLQNAKEGIATMFATV